MNTSNTSILMTIFGIISCISSSYVIILYFFYKSLHKSIYNKVIYYISICNFFVSLGGSFGYVHEDTFICYLQTILTNIFPLSSVFWVTVLIYLFLTLITTQQSINNLNYSIHIFCWLLPILLTFLPLTTNSFGVIDGEIGWCWLDERSNTPKWSSFFWNLVSFYFWMWSSIGVYVIFYIYILISVRSRDFRSSENILRTLHKISLYPLIVVCCWILPCIFDQIDYYRPNNPTTNNTIFDELSSITPLLQGTLTSLVFVIFNSEVRNIFLEGTKVYLNLFCCKQFFQEMNPTDESYETSAQISSSRISSTRINLTNTTLSGNNQNQNQNHNISNISPSFMNISPSNVNSINNNGETYCSEIISNPLSPRQQSIQSIL